jgi:hypothetical protein
LTGVPAFALLPGVETATMGVATVAVREIVWSPNAPEVSHARTSTVCFPLFMLTVGSIAFVGPA